MEIKFERKGKLPDLKGKSRQHCVMAGRRASGWVVVEWKEFPNSLGAEEVIFIWGKFMRR